MRRCHPAAHPLLLFLHLELRYRPVGAAFTEPSDRRTSRCCRPSSAVCPPDSRRVRACVRARVIITGCFTLRGTVCGRTACVRLCWLFSVVVKQQNRLGVDAANFKGTFKGLYNFIPFHLHGCQSCLLLRTNSWFSSVCPCQQSLNNRWDPHPQGLSHFTCF